MDKLFPGGALAPTVPQILLKAAPVAAQGVLFPRTTGGQIGKAVFQGLAGIAPQVADAQRQQQVLDVTADLLQRTGQQPSAAIPSFNVGGQQQPSISGSQVPQLAQNPPRNFTEFLNQQPESDRRLLQAITNAPFNVKQEVFFTKPKVLKPKEQLRQDAIENTRAGILGPAFKDLEQQREFALGFGRPPAPKALPVLSQDLNETADELYPGSTFRSIDQLKKLEVRELIAKRRKQNKEDDFDFNRRIAEATGLKAEKLRAGTPFEPRGGVLLDPETLETVVVSKADALKAQQSGRAFFVNNDQLKQIGLVKKARGATDQLEKLVSRAVKASGPFETLGQAFTLGIQSFFPGTLATTINQLRLGQAGLYARFISTEVGRLTDPDIKRALGFIPGNFDSMQTMQFKFNMIRRFEIAAIDSIRKGTSFSDEIRKLLDEGEKRLSELGGSLSDVDPELVAKTSKNADRWANALGFQSSGLPTLLPKGFTSEKIRR